MVIWSNMDPVLVMHVVVGTVLPFVVGLVTTKLTPGWVKGCLLVAFTLASNVGAEAAEAMVVGVPFRVVDAVVFSAAQLAYSVALHKSVIAPGPVADWLATHVRKADPNQVQLIEMGWAGPLPSPKDAERFVGDAAKAVDVKLEGSVLASTTPDLIAPVEPRTDQQTMDDWDVVAKDRRSTMVTRLEQGAKNPMTRDDFEAWERPYTEDPKHRADG